MEPINHEPTAEIEPQPTTAEILDPRRVPEIAFQSYESLKNNSAALREYFINDKFRNPDLEYKFFSQENFLNDEASNLEATKQQILEAEADGFKRSVILSSIDFRLAEIGYVQMLAEIDQELKGDDPAQAIAKIEIARQLNERLYGKPKPEVVDAILNQIWQKIDGKELSDSAKKLYDELKNGFYYDYQYVEGLPYAENPESSLPDLGNEAIAWAGEYIMEKNSDLEALVSELWQQKVEEFGEDYQATPEDIKFFFESTLDLRDPDHQSGVTIQLDEGGKSLSWNSAELAVKIGANRSPIKSKDDMFTKIMHEFGVHGQRAINGFKTELPILGSGLFTDTERADYLTFEEGLAVTLETAMKDKKPEWSITGGAGHYLGIALADMGHDFREAYELTWRYRTLYDLKDQEEVTDEMIQKKKQTTYNSLIRIFRGNPLNLADSGIEALPLTYNKDLAYLNGRILAMDYLDDLCQVCDVNSLDQLFAAKFDPTIPEQLAIVEQYGQKF